MRITSSDPEPQAGDVRELMGLRTAAAAVLVAFFIVTYAVVGYWSAPRGGLWVEVLAWLVVSVAAVVLIRAERDPIGFGWTAFIAVAGPAAAALVFGVLPAGYGTSLAAWPLSAATVLSTYLCVRGRTIIAWVSLLTAIAVCVGWAHVTGQGALYGVTMSLINLAPLIMATFFAFTIRPAARDIFALREAGVAATAAEAAHGAVLEERDRQLVRLDARARPLLERLAEPVPLTAEERRACALVEAQLRDSLRAPVLDRPDVVDAAWQARSRGVEVVLLDDHGLDEVPGPVRGRVVGAVVPTLAGARSGTVTVRILPPGRRVLATVLRADGENVERTEFDRDGALISVEVD